MSGGSSRVAMPCGLFITVSTARPLGSPVTVALRPEAVTVEPIAAEDSPASANTADAVVEQIVYHGFVSRLYLKQKNGEPLIAFQQNQAGGAGPMITAGMEVRARWAEASNHIVRD